MSSATQTPDPSQPVAARHDPHQIAVIPMPAPSFIRTPLRTVSGLPHPVALCRVAVRLAWPLHLSPGKGPPLRMVNAATVSLAFNGFKTVFTDAWLETLGQCRQDRDDGAVCRPRRNLWLARPVPVAAPMGRAVARVKTLVANGVVIANRTFESTPEISRDDIADDKPLAVQADVPGNRTGGAPSPGSVDLRPAGIGLCHPLR